MRTNVVRGLFALPVVAVMAACSSAADPTAIGSHFKSAATSGSGSTAGAGDTNSATPGIDAPSLGSNTDGGSSNVSDNPDAACVTSAAKAEQLPVYLVFMFDRSGSMDQSSKWTSCAAGLKSFFADPASAGLFASIQFFSSNNECSTASYSNPLVPMKALPDATTFASAIDATSPNGGTPTLPALKGAIQYAQANQAANPAGKTAVVLVTDGDPNDCNSTVTNVSAEAASVASTLPTYVIGVGSSTSNLNAIALGGGTTQAIIVNTANPAQITTDFEKAVQTIKQSAITCEYAIPTPPNGLKLDVNNVNVVFTAGNGTPSTLTYDKDCTGAGWHYDDPNAPTKVEICPTSCDSIKTDPAGSVNVLFGCATKGGVTK